MQILQLIVSRAPSNYTHNASQTTTASHDSARIQFDTTNIKFLGTRRRKFVCFSSLSMISRANICRDKIEAIDLIQKFQLIYVN